MFEPPINCPKCQSKLEFSSTGIDLVCANSYNCPAQILGRLSYFCQRNIGNIAGLSEKTIEVLIDKFGVHDIYDLYNLPFDKIIELENFGAKSVQNMEESIDKSRDITDFKFLAGIGIDGVGVEVARLICEEVNR
jgi:DNA ligase (NAD+)